VCRVGVGWGWGGAICGVRVVCAARPGALCGGGGRGGSGLFRVWCVVRKKERKDIRSRGGLLRPRCLFGPRAKPCTKGGGPKGNQKGFMFREEGEFVGGGRARARARARALCQRGVCGTRAALLRSGRAGPFFSEGCWYRWWWRLPAQAPALSCVGGAGARATSTSSDSCSRLMVGRARARGRRTRPERGGGGGRETQKKESAREGRAVTGPGGVDARGVVLFVCVEGGGGGGDK